MRFLLPKSFINEKQSQQYDDGLNYMVCTFKPKVAPQPYITSDEPITNSEQLFECSDNTLNKKSKISNSNIWANYFTAISDKFDTNKLNQTLGTPCIISVIILHCYVEWCESTIFF